MKAIRYSGVRLDQTAYTWRATFDTICQNALNYGQEILIESLKEPYLYYDTLKNRPLIDLMKTLLINGELFFALEEDKPIGYAFFHSIIAGQKAALNIYVLPEYRMTPAVADFREILYNGAFKPFPEGLQLHKVYATVHPDNHASLTGCKNSGFVELVRLPVEGLYSGALTDMIYLELYARELTELAKPVEIIQDVRPIRSRKTDTVSNGDVHIKHSPRTRRKSAKLPSDRTESTIQS